MGLINKWRVNADRVLPWRRKPQDDAPDASYYSDRMEQLRTKQLFDESAVTAATNGGVRVRRHRAHPAKKRRRQIVRASRKANR